MQLISHRGAKGLELENTLASVMAASKQPVEYIEFDVRLTKDHQLILCHDPYTPSGTEIAATTFAHLKKVEPSIITLTEALEACGDKKPLIELKNAGSAQYVAPWLSKHPTAAVASFLASEVAELTILSPNTKIFLLQHNHPFGIIKKAKRLQATGVGLNKNWALLLPHYYWHGRRAKLDVYTYTVNSTFLVALCMLIMPKLLVCTDVPHKMQNIQRTKNLLVIASVVLFVSILFEIILLSYKATLT